MLHFAQGLYFDLDLRNETFRNAFLNDLETLDTTLKLRHETDGMPLKTSDSRRFNEH